MRADNGVLPGSASSHAQGMSSGSLGDHGGIGDGGPRSANEHADSGNTGGSLMDASGNMGNSSSPSRSGTSVRSNSGSGSSSSKSEGLGEPAGRKAAAATRYVMSAAAVVFSFGGLQEKLSQVGASFWWPAEEAIVGGCQC